MDLKSSNQIECPPVSAIQPNEVIMEPDTNTHRVSFAVENLPQISVQREKPPVKRYLFRMCGKVADCATVVPDLFAIIATDLGGMRCVPGS